MKNRNVKSLDAHKVELRKHLALVETAGKLLKARDRLTDTREHLAVGDGMTPPADKYLGRCIKLSLSVAHLDLELKDLPLYTGDNFQAVLDALANSCEFAAEAMLHDADVD